MTKQAQTQLQPLLLLIVLLSSGGLSSGQELCNAHDKNILLLGIKEHFNNASVFATWIPDTDCCQNWSGIQCNSDGRVIMLAVTIADIVGGIPPAIGDLPFLEFIALSGSSGLTGTIPLAFAKLANLNHLDFSLNQLSGPIPDFLGQFKNLDDIDLSSNAFTGSIPASLGRLTKLRTMNLGSNQLSGSIPPALGGIKSLIQLYLYSNALSGPIPGSFAQLRNLNELDLRQNQLTGSIPASFGSFKNSDLNIDLSFNRLSGPTPSAFGNANVTAINLSNNNITGDASFLFGRGKTVLTAVDLSNNHFQFDFSSVDLPRGLKKLYISHNLIFGSLPGRLGQLPLKDIDVSFNQLCGQIPVGRRLKQFSPAKFSNNKCLCGLPLPACK